GMATRLQLQADHTGSYRGLSAQFSGEGFADMRFTVDAVSTDQFAQWVAEARSAGPVLGAETYADLAKPSKAAVPFTYRAVAPNLFNSVTSSGARSDESSPIPYPMSQKAEK